MIRAQNHPPPSLSPCLLSKSMHTHNPHSPAAAPTLHHTCKRNTGFSNSLECILSFCELSAPVWLGGSQGHFSFWNDSLCLQNFYIPIPKLPELILFYSHPIPPEWTWNIMNMKSNNKSHNVQPPKWSIHTICFIWPSLAHVIFHGAAHPRQDTLSKDSASCSVTLALSILEYTNTTSPRTRALLPSLQQRDCFL